MRGMVVERVVAAKQPPIERFRHLLSELGCACGFSCADSSDEVVWEKSTSLRITFKLHRGHVTVSAAHTAHPDTLSQWGTATYADLERALSRYPDTHEPLSPPQPATPQALRLKVLSNQRVCEDHYLMRLKVPRGTRIAPQPGQFFHVICDPVRNEVDPYPLTLRRPFSIHGIAYAGFRRELLASAGDIPLEISATLVRQPAEVNFLYKVVGRGTSALTRVMRGQVLDVIGPCGHGFDIDTTKEAVLVAGGIGTAPLVALAEQLRFLGIKVHMYLGALKGEFLAPALCRPERECGWPADEDTPEFRQLILDEFREIGVPDVHICTDDGSAGEKGFVTAILERHLRTGVLPKDNICVYTCGPHGMLRAVVDITRRYALPCQVSMEERMACGIGACMGCTCKTVTPDGSDRKRVCKDGPVFNAEEIQF